MEILSAHGAGNTFAVLIDPDGTRRLSAALAVALCDPDGPYGADGAIRVAPTASGDVVMDHRNADGSLAEMCGNGVRVVARVALEHGLVAGDTTTLTVRSLAGPREVRITRDEDGAFATASVSMGAPVRDPAAVGFAASWARADMGGRWHLEDVPLAFDVVSMGNPHAVVPVERVVDAPLDTLGLDLQSHPAFAEGVNVGFVAVLDPSRVALRVLERGVGETAACGTGACAAVAVLRARGLVDATVEVEVPGGVLRVTDTGDDLVLEGPARITAIHHVDAAWSASVPAVAADGWSTSGA
jgi:diaminopimelate epimerase